MLELVQKQLAFTVLIRCMEQCATYLTIGYRFTRYKEFRIYVVKIPFEILATQTFTVNRKRVDMLMNTNFFMLKYS